MHRGEIRLMGRIAMCRLQTRVFVVFWSKNPKPLIPYLPILQEKGYWQIVEVIKAKGFNFIEPATFALICGKDPRISGRQQTMLEEEGIDYINVFNLLR